MCDVTMPDVTMAFRLCLALAVGVVVGQSARAGPPDLAGEPRCLGESVLHEAVAGGDVRSVARILREAPELRLATNALGQTPLAVAVAQGDLAMVARLLRGAGEELEIDDAWGATPLVAALWGGHDAIALRLLAAGADVERVTRDGGGALHAAARRGSARLVAQVARAIGRGEGAEARAELLAAALSGADAAGLTPLDHAVLSGSRHTVAQLLRLGAPAHALALAYACGLSRIDMARWLAPRVPRRGPAPLDAALESALGARDDEIERVDPLAVSCLLDAGATPSTSALRLALAAERSELAALLVMRAAPEFGVGRGDPMLHVVAAAGERGLVQAMVLSGAPVDALDAEGATPLLRAVLADSADGVAALLEAGADAEPTFRGLGARALAVRYGARRALGALVAALGHDVESAAALDDREALAGLLAARPELARAAGSEGLTALHIAARYGARGAVELLVERGAEVDRALAVEARFGERDVSGWSALHFAAQGGHRELYQWFLARGARDEPAGDGRYAASRIGAGMAEVASDQVGDRGWGQSWGWHGGSDGEEWQSDMKHRPPPPPPTTSSEGGAPAASFSGLGGGLLHEERRMSRELIPDWRLIDAETQGRGPELSTALERCIASAHWFEAERVARMLLDERALAPLPEMLMGAGWRGRALLEASTLQTLGRVLIERLRFSQSQDAFDAAERALTVWGAADSERAATTGEVLQVLPADRLWTAIALGRARLHARTGAFDQAEAALRDGLARLPLEGAVLAPLRATLQGGLVLALGEASRYDEAIAAARTALSLIESDTLAGGHDEGAPSPHVIRSNLGTLLGRVGEKAEARALAMEELARYDAGEVLDVEEAALIRYTAGLWRVLDGAPTDGEALMVAAREGLAELFPRHPALGRYDLGIGLMRARAGRKEAAAEALAQGRAALMASEGALVPEALSPAASLDYARILGAEAALEREAGRLERALELVESAYAIVVGSQALEAQAAIELELARVQAARGHLGVAIFFGKRAVATLEHIDRRHVPEAMRAGFIEDRLAAWRELADHLAAEGRFLEATAALRAIKDGEADALATRGGKADEGDGGEGAPRQEARRGARPLAVLPEIGAERQSRRPARILEVAQRDADRLARDVAAGRPGGAGGAGGASAERLDAARQTLRERRRLFEAWLRTLEAQLDQMPPERARAIAAMNLRDLSAMQDTLATVGEGVVMVHYLITDDRLRAIVTTAESQTGREAPIAARALNALVFQLRQVLSDASRDPRAAANALYQALIAPIEPELEAAGARTLLVSLDGALRYVPLAALWDGSRWLVERYRIVNFARAALPRITATRAATESLAAFGCARTVPGFEKLDAVPSELEGIVKRGAGDPDGELPGVVMLDDAFSRESLTEVLGERRYNAVHIASHFVLGPGGEDESYLLLGDGSRLTLEDIRYDLRFDGVDLLSLSACNTAVGDDSAHDGREIEGFASLAMRLGARAVLATLWPVSDASTGLFMREVYRLMRQDPQRSRAEVLQRAMLSFIRGEVRLEPTGPAGATGRGASPLALASDPATAAVPASAAAPLSAAVVSPSGGTTERAIDLAHPRYWAPFVFIGNWR